MARLAPPVLDGSGLADDGVWLDKICAVPAMKTAPSRTSRLDTTCEQTRLPGNLGAVCEGPDMAQFQAAAARILLLRRVRARFALSLPVFRRMATLARASS